MMCPGSTKRPSTGRTHRYYRCSTREKHCKDKCAGRPLPAPAIEAFVVARISERAADGTLAPRVAAHLATSASCARSWSRRSPRPRRRRRSSPRRCCASKGRARELVEQKLGVEADRLAGCEPRLRDLEGDAAELKIVKRDHTWFVPAPGDFAKVWVNMSPDNRGASSAR
jgi:site-specific DNA recombinase